MKKLKIRKNAQKRKSGNMENMGIMDIMDIMAIIGIIKIKENNLNMDTIDTQNPQALLKENTTLIDSKKCTILWTQGLFMKSMKG